MIILADVVWPSLILVGSLYTWWIIGVGLIIEFFFVRWLTRAEPLKAALMTIVMNAISSCVGFIGIPLSGLAWEFIAMVTIMPLFHWGTFNPITWLVSCILAALLNALIETASLRWIFKVQWTKRLFWWLALANFITVGMALVGMTAPFKPSRARSTTQESSISRREIIVDDTLRRMSVRIASLASEKKDKQLSELVDRYHLSTLKTDSMDPFIRERTLEKLSRDLITISKTSDNAKQIVTEFRIRTGTQPIAPANASEPRR